MLSLADVLDKFKNDKSRNTEYKDGSHRFDDKLEWIEKTVREYAEHFSMSEDEVITIMENNRTYSWPNYYQEANFKSVSDFDSLLGIYKTFDDFNNYSNEHWKGFKCPKCGTIGSHPQICIHRLNKDNKCDWVADGLFREKDGIIVLENGFDVIPIFEPVHNNEGRG